MHSQIQTRVTGQWFVSKDKRFAKNRLRGRERSIERERKHGREGKERIDKKMRKRKKERKKKNERNWLKLVSNDADDVNDFVKNCFVFFCFSFWNLDGGLFYMNQPNELTCNLILLLRVIFFPCFRISHEKKMCLIWLFTFIVGLLHWNSEYGNSKCNFSQFNFKLFFLFWEKNN